MWAALASFILFKVWGWKVAGDFPHQLRKYIVVVGPHTSNWDFPFGILLRTIRHVDVKFIGKSSLFRPPFGGIFRALGGYPVDRSKSNNFVDAVVDIFNSKSEFIVAITPEGTRKKVTEFKTGFYYIALGAKVPLISAIIDYETKTVTLTEPYYPTGNKEVDFEHFLNHFRGIKGRNPEDGIFF
ncbi:MAG: 1-acyl-sn-glycerol-3-phosphate acyltransferase [Saprospiraceae bacterium]|jgi:1-acyl-sn-glycerol-3-phosphate acyltransferase